jgi:hypothetical protein
LRLDRLPSLSSPLIPLVELIKLLSVDLGKSRTIVGAHQGPFTVLFHSSHEKIGDPERVEQITRSDFFLSVILSKIDKVEHVGVPRLEVDAAKPWL